MTSEPQGSAVRESAQHRSYLTATRVGCTTRPMSEMTVKVTLSETDVDALAQCMARMKSTDDDGKLRSITIPDAIREAIRKMAKGAR